jgi:hypothetical protein
MSPTQKQAGYLLDLLAKRFQQDWDGATAWVQEHSVSHISTVTVSQIMKRLDVDEVSSLIAELAK